MAEKQIVKPVALAVGAALAGSFAVTGTASADTGASPFSMTTLSAGYLLGAGVDQEKAEGSCGGDKEKAEGSCGGDKEKAEGSCGGDKEKAEGSCGGDKEGAAKEEAEGKCGEGKCGGEKETG